MKQLATIVCLLFAVQSSGQLLQAIPVFIHDTSSSVEIIADASKGNKGLYNYATTSDVYVHIGVITGTSANSSDWKYVKFTWGTADANAQCTYLGNNKWKYIINGGLRNFFGITDPNEKIKAIAILFRSGDGNMVLRNADGSDMYLPVYDNALHVRIDEPYSQPTYIPVLEPLNKYVGDSITIVVHADTTAALYSFFDGQEKRDTGTTLTYKAEISTSGAQIIFASAKTANEIDEDSIYFYVTNSPNTADLPAGVTEGINYEPGDTSVILVLYAPGKSTINIIGDFNNWQQSPAYQMNETPDEKYFWKRITGLTPGKEYAYQYIIDGSLKVADYNAEKILDPDNDPSISTATYPDLKPYPTGKTTGIVSVLQTGQPVYDWQVKNFQRPDKRNLLIYELLLRDFVSPHNWQTLTDTLSYLKHLGINAIEVMPFNEFEGNDSWGYNPDFYFAPDKAYGTPAALKQFIDACHQQGIAVIMDMVLNHSFGQSPMVQMYWDAANNRPAVNNPWFNPVAKHAYNVGYDFNHESPATKTFVDRVMKYWLTNYKLDGFRFDLAKGFTQKQTCDDNGNNCDVNAWGAYDSSRVAIWKNIYDEQQSISAGSYCILEMFANNDEEKVEANYGMMLWGNLNYNFNQATMGYNTDWNFDWGIYTARGWSQPHLITYQESHDEERLMYKNLQYGNSNGSYSIKNLSTALQRNAMAAAFWAMIPGPKMMWQFGELGYDYSINTCTNGSIDNSCRTSDKPIRWDYYQNADRKKLYDVYAKLFRLREMPNYISTFTTGDIQYDLAGAVKTMSIASDSLDVEVVGNFDVAAHTGTIDFPAAGNWYSYLTDSIYKVNTLTQNLNLQPGEYYVFVNKNIDNIKTDSTVTKPPTKPPEESGGLDLQLFPNPLNSHHLLQVAYQVPHDEQIMIDLLDSEGRKMNNLFNGFQKAGSYTFPIHIGGFSGACFIRVSSKEKSVTKMLIIIP